MNINLGSINLFGIYAPWGNGIGTLGLKVGRFYADIFWSNWTGMQNEEGYISLRAILDNPGNLLPSGIYLRAPWVIIRGKVIGGGQYYLRFRRFWRGFQRRKGS